MPLEGKIITPRIKPPPVRNCLNKYKISERTVKTTRHPLIIFVRKHNVTGGGGGYPVLGPHKTTRGRCHLLAAESPQCPQPGLARGPSPLPSVFERGPLSLLDRIVRVYVCVCSIQHIRTMKETQTQKPFLLQA